jgi:hypothetical protein
MTRQALAFLATLLATLATFAQVGPRDQVDLLPLRNALGPGRLAQPGLGQARAIHEPFIPPVTAAKIRTAIDDAVLYLRGLQAPNGSIDL